MELLIFIVLVVVLVAAWLGLIVGAVVGWSALCAAVGRSNKDIVERLRQMFFGKKPAAEGEHAHDDHGSMNANYVVWGILIVFTLVEVALAYIELPTLIMLVTLMGLSIVKAFLIMAFFMHLKFERLNFVLTIVPATVITILLLSPIFLDSFRKNEYREMYHSADPEAHEVIEQKGHGETGDSQAPKH